MTKYLCILGRNQALSRAELKNFCDEIWYDEEKSLLIAEKLNFQNPRQLPKKKEQLFLDRLGGVIRFGEILGEFFSENELKQEIVKNLTAQKPEGKLHLGISQFGAGRNFLRNFLPQIKETLRKTHDRNCRIVNNEYKNLDSGKIFGEKLLRKGFEFIIVKQNKSYLLAQTLANQNLQNYTLRDREKQFRDARLGMLPPKLAQILINLANPNPEDTIIDPFCGTGTINIEAAIAGYRTIGSDIESKVLTLAKQNFAQMAEKFRYQKDTGNFSISDATKMPLPKTQSIIATEGFLGENFTKPPDTQTIQKNAKTILHIWKKIFTHLEKSKIHTISFCLPSWNTKGQNVSVSEELFAKIQKNGYSPLALFNNKKTYLYYRPGAFVARGICVVRKCV